MNVTIRPLNPETDYPRLVQIFNRLFAEPSTVELLERQDVIRDPNMIMQRSVALNPAGEIVASAVMMQPPWRREKQFQINLAVDPDVQHKGVGTLLYNHSLAFMAKYPATHLFSIVQDDQPQSMAFAEHRGFKIDRHIFDSILSVDTFDESPYISVIKAVEGSGIHFTSFAEHGDTETNRRTLFDLNSAAWRDVPGNNNPRPDYHNFQKVMLDSPKAIPDGIILALDGEKWVGFSGLWYMKEDTLVHFMTGVDAAYRGRKIALVLKLLCIRYAKRTGVSHLMANNDSANAPMLAINNKLGYKRQIGNYQLIRTL